MSQPMVAFHVNGREVSVQDQQGQTLLDVFFQMQQPSLGAGECSSGPTCAAIGNAIFDAIGVRMRAMPFTPEKIHRGQAHFGLFLNLSEKSPACKY